MGSSILSAALATLDPRLSTQAAEVLLGEVLTPYVAFTVDEDLLSDVLPAWWTLVIQHALSAFVRVNGLSESVRRTIGALAPTGAFNVNTRPH